MKKEVVLSTVAGSVLMAATMLPALAADVAAPAASMSVADTWWVYHGEAEAGGRFFLNNPQKDGIKSQGGQALGKYYEYSDIKPGPFGQFWLNGQTKDGLYNFNVWGDNVGYNDQRYEADGSKAGEHYIDVIWDQTPHVYSTNAQTLYSGLGGPALVLPPGLSNSLFDAAGCTRVAGQIQPGGCTAGNITNSNNANAVKNIINNNVYTTDLGIRRDTAGVAYRWTPTDAWDINVAYTNMHRWGTQAEGVVFSPGTSGVAAQVPKPVNDTTQNFGINGEYKGTSPWGKSFTFQLGYSGSIFQEDFGSYTVQNPFCDATTPQSTAGVGQCARNGSSSSPFALMTLWPNNSAHSVNSTIGADLPWKSRYMGTVSYTWMRQNDAFIPSPYTQLFNGATPGALVAAPGLPASSLNGAINTLLSNNVVTTQITPELKSKLSYRYYDFNNNTPELNFTDWTLTDVRSANSVTSAYAPVQSLSISYNKQNAGAELVWSPNRQWNVGTGYGWERYNWTRADANVTNENSGKVFADYKPWSWLLARASWTFSDRQYDTYNYRGFVGNAQWNDSICINPFLPPIPAGQACNTQYSTAFRQFYLDNRQRQIGKFQVAIDVLRGLTVTPTFGYQDDNYSISATEAGLTRLQSVKGGVEVAYAISPGVNILFAYMNEYYRQNLKFTTASNIQEVNSGNTWHSDVRDNVNTIMAAANWAAIPEKLDLRLAYTISISNTDQPLYADSGAQPNGAFPPNGGTGGQFPNIKGQWSRLEAQAKYTFDKGTVRMFVINGEAFAKLRYVWERNSVNNIDQDIMQPYMNALINNGGFMTWMAFDNPNYNAHLMGASLGVKW
jgi:MtrB/PioB family decaheme-associated outer membrane protein